ncbi:STAS domain-containing protein [Streptomyces sp. LUP30]|uniref:STAS domain-containing protein n=1 Tax=Streptomyces sp. LUP30 TaxID=1890285 RepID=UPI000851E590|nr:STAS domain-containing protein [Streptomyces sp. LUP30]
MNVFGVTTQHHPTRTVITVAGDMDLQTHPQLAQAASLVPEHCTSLEMDLSGVSFMDSSGLNLLLLLRRRLQAQGGRLTLTGLRHQPRHLLALTGTDRLLTADTAGHHRPQAPRRPRG